MKNYYLIVAFILLFTTECFSHSGAIHTTIKSGIGIGSIIAIVASWDRNKSILWSVLHGCLGWIYVIYYAITRK